MRAEASRPAPLQVEEAVGQFPRLEAAFWAQARDVGIGQQAATSSCEIAGGGAGQVAAIAAQVNARQHRLHDAARRGSLHLVDDGAQRAAAALPRRLVTMQKVQRLLQPSCT